MGWSWSLISQEDLLSSYPMIFLLSILSICFYVLLYKERNLVIPREWPVLGMTPGLLLNLHRLNDYVVALLRATGGTFLFKGPWLMDKDFMLTCDPSNAKYMYNTHFADYPKGRDLTEIFDILGNGIFNVNGKLWSKHRKIAHSILNGQMFGSSVAKCSHEKVEKAVLPLMDRLARLGHPFDLQDFFSRLTMDITSTLVLGVDPGCLSLDGATSNTYSIAKSIEDTEEVFFNRHIRPWWKLQRWLRVGQEKKMVTACEKVCSFIVHCICMQEKKKKKDIKSCSTQGKDVLSLYMNLPMEKVDTEEEEDHDRYFRSVDFVYDTLVTFMASGKDTTAASLSWFFWLVARNPDVEEKILEELNQLRHSKDDDVDTVAFEVNEVERMVYMHAAVCESLRLYPPVPYNNKSATKEDVLPSGHRVGPGMSVRFSNYSSARMESVWGEDCLEFKPERWINDKGELRHVPSYKFLVFHSGPRTCPGKNMAFTMVKVVAASIIYNFQVKEVRGWEVEHRLSIILQMKNGFKVTVAKRERSSANK